MFDHLNKMIAPNLKGRPEAEANVEIFDDYRNFFVPAREACRCYMLLGLSKFFDGNRQCLTIPKILDYAQTNITKLSEEDFLRYHSEQGRKFEDELIKQYSPISLEEIGKIREKIRGNEAVIKKLKDHGDQYLAYDDIKKADIRISVGEAEKALDLIKEIIDIFRLRLDFSSTYYGYLEEGPVEDIERLVHDLRKCRGYRKRDMMKKIKNYISK